MGYGVISRIVLVVSITLTIATVAWGQKSVSVNHRPMTRVLRWSQTRQLRVRGGTVKMVSASGKTLWTYSTEPNEILDVAVGPRGLIYVTSFDGIVDILNPRGKRIWGHFMSGSANYSQIRPFRGGFLVVLDMETYRSERVQVVKILLSFGNTGSVFGEKTSRPTPG